MTQDGGGLISLKEGHGNVGMAKNLTILALAVFVDFTDILPTEVLLLFGITAPIHIGLQGGISLMQLAVLNYLEIPLPRMLAIAALDLVPIVGLIPWCTMAVLDRRFGFRLPYLTRLYNTA